MDIENRLRILGHAERMVVPDTARWQVIVRVEHRDQRVAFQRAAEARSSLLDRLRAIDEGCATSERINVLEEFETYTVVDANLQKAVLEELSKSSLPAGVIAQVGEFIGETRRRRRCFSATSSIGIHIEVARASGIPDALVGEHIASVSGPRFEIQEREGILDELRVEAVTNARTRASALATSAERRLGRSLILSDQDESLSALASGREGGDDYVPHRRQAVSDAMRCTRKPPTSEVRPVSPWR